MRRTKIHIPIQNLIEFVKTNEVAWQKCDSLIEFSHAEGYEITEEERNEYEVKNNEMLDALANAEVCQVFNPKKDDWGGFEDLVEWSEGKDLLILIDNELLLCIAPCDKEQVLAMLA